MVYFCARPCGAVTRWYTDFWLFPFQLPWTPGASHRRVSFIVGLPVRRLRNRRMRIHRGAAEQTSQRDAIRDRGTALSFTGASGVLSSPRAVSGRGPAGKRFPGIAVNISAWDFRKENVRNLFSAGPVRASTVAATEKRGVANVSFGIGPHYHILELLGETVSWNCRFTVDRLRLYRNIASAVA